MEASLESRLEEVEERLRVVESLLSARPTAAWPPASPRSAPPAPARPAREPLDLEELLGGRVLGWAGGVAVVVAAVFFLAMAIHNGWIDEATRVSLAFGASALLAAAGVWLYEAKGRTQAARAATAAGIAAFYASDTAASALYHLVPAAAGLAVAGAVGATATAIAIRWSSTELAGIGIVGALLAPVLVDAGTSSASLVFMALALCAAVGVLVWRRWGWLAAVAYVVSAPQVARWLLHEHDVHLGRALAVTAAFWALYVVAAIGYELREPTARLRIGSASLLFTNASLTALAGWSMLHDAGNGFGATAWVIAVAATHAMLGVTVLRTRASSEIGALLVAVSSALAAVALALVLDGPALVAGWAAEAVLMAWVGRRSGDGRAFAAAVAFVAAAAVHALVLEAPPKALAYGVESLPQAAAALALVVGALLAVSALFRGREEGASALAATVGAVYLASVAVVELVGRGQHGQLALSALWAALGFAGLVAGLVRDARAVRLAGLALLGLAVVKVFVVDLAALASIWRVASFFVIGLVLLAGAFAYQRMRTEAVA
jgi:uncharacterized membrane protein